MIKIRLKHDLPLAFVAKWTRVLGNPGSEAIRCGWITWERISENEFIQRSRNSENIHPENNKYSINFPANYFELISEDNTLRL